MGQGDNNALDLDSTFDVTLPDLKLARCDGSRARPTRRSCRSAGQQINELDADTTYAQQQLHFNAVAKQGDAAADRRTARRFCIPDHQEVHLPGASRCGPRTSSGRRIRHRIRRSSIGNKRIVVDDIKLVNGDQRHRGAGRDRRSGSETLRVKADNVDVAQLDALMLGDQRLAGRLNANATVSGTTAAPRVAGDFTLSQGAFRNFKFMSFGGKVDYAGKRA